MKSQVTDYDGGPFPPRGIQVGQRILRVLRWANAHDCNFTRTKKAVYGRLLHRAVEGTAKCQLRRTFSENITKQFLYAARAVIGDELVHQQSSNAAPPVIAARDNRKLDTRLVGIGAHRAEFRDPEVRIKPQKRPFCFHSRYSLSLFIEDAFKFDFVMYPHHFSFDFQNAALCQIAQNAIGMNSGHAHGISNVRLSEWKLITVINT